MRRDSKLAIIVAVVLTGGSLVATLGCGGRESSPRDVEVGVGDVTVAVPAAPAGVDCLQNEFGIHRKVIIVQGGVRCQDRPDGQLTGQPLRFFWPYFVFEAAQGEGGRRYYRIGTTPRRGSVLGWVPETVAAPWDTRVGKRYIPHFPLLVYRSKEALVEVLKTGSTSEEPIARATRAGEDAWMPWPVAESAQVEVNGKVFELVRLQFLAEYRQGTDLAGPQTPRAGGKGYSAEEIERIKGGVKMLDVVFVVDNTGSTRPFLVAIRETVEAIARRLRDLPFKPDVCFGLVLYRDHVASIMFRDGGAPSVVKVFPMTTDLDAFVQTVRPLDCAHDSSEDWAEAGYDGLLAGLNQSWRGEKLSNRVVLWISDNSAHTPPSPKNPRGIGEDELIALARRADRNVKVFSLCINGGGGEDEQRLHWEQCERLAAATGGSCHRLDNNPDEVAGRIVDRIRALLEQETAVVRDRYRTVEMLQQGKTPEQILAETEMDVRRLVNVMEFLKGAGVDVERIGPGVPTFATGWCVSEVRGRTVLGTEVYIGRSELDLLLGELNTLCAQLSPEFTRQLVDLAAVTRVHPGSFFAERRAEPMDVFLMAKGIPCPNGVLKLTQEEVRSGMSEHDRAVLRERIARTVIPQLTNARTDNRNFTWVSDVEFGWIKESLLP